MFELEKVLNLEFIGCVFWNLFVVGDVDNFKVIYVLFGFISRVFVVVEWSGFWVYLGCLCWWVGGGLGDGVVLCCEWVVCVLGVVWIMWVGFECVGLGCYVIVLFYKVLCVCGGGCGWMVVEEVVV